MHYTIHPRAFSAVQSAKLPTARRSDHSICKCKAGNAVTQPSHTTRLLASALAAVHLGVCSMGAIQLITPPPAQAVLNSPNSRIARNPEAALRRAIPAFNPAVKEVQNKLEDIQYLMRIPQRKPWGSMTTDLQAAQGITNDESKMMVSVPDALEAEGKALIQEVNEKLDRLQFSIDRKDADRTGIAVSKALNAVARLEVLQAPALGFSVPAAYKDLPLLTGRAEVELIVEKKSGTPTFIDYEKGGVSTQGVVNITLDGYSAPVSAGNFASLVQAGKYDNMKLVAGYSSVIAGQGAQPNSQIPIEILPLGEFSPVYRLPLDVRGGELPVLPLSVRGAIAMAKSPDAEGFLSGEEFFIFKFDSSQAGLAGLAFDEGEFGVFAYVTQGMDSVVAVLENGDRIVSAKLISGAERLINVR